MIHVSVRDNSSKGKSGQLCKWQRRIRKMCLG